MGIATAQVTEDVAKMNATQLKAFMKGTITSLRNTANWAGVDPKQKTLEEQNIATYLAAEEIGALDAMRKAAIPFCVSNRRT